MFNTYLCRILTIISVKCNAMPVTAYVLIGLSKHEWYTLSQIVMFTNYPKVDFNVNYFMGAQTKALE